MKSSKNNIPKEILKLFRIVYFDEDISESNIDNFNDIYTTLSSTFTPEECKIFSLYELDEVELIAENLYKTNKGLLEVINKENEKIYLLEKQNPIIVTKSLIMYEQYTNRSLLISTSTPDNVETYFIQEDLNTKSDIKSTICDYLQIESLDLINESENTYSDGTYVFNIPNLTSQLYTGWNMDKCDYYVFDLTYNKVNIFVYSV